MMNFDHGPVGLFYYIAFHSQLLLHAKTLKKFKFSTPFNMYNDKKRLGDFWQCLYVRVSKKDRLKLRYEAFIQTHKILTGIVLILSGIVHRLVVFESDWIPRNHVLLRNQSISHGWLFTVFCNFWKGIRFLHPYREPTCNPRNVGPSLRLDLARPLKALIYARNNTTR